MGRGFPLGWGKGRQPGFRSAAPFLLALSPTMRGFRGPAGVPRGMEPSSRYGDPQPAPLPGDWFCTACGNQNYAHRTYCHNRRCTAPRSPRAAEVAIPANAWQCGLCGIVVYDNPEHLCPRCLTPGEPMAAGQPEVLEQAGGRPARVRRRAGGVHGGDAPLVGFLLRLFRGQPTRQEQERRVEQLMVQGENDDIWVYVTTLANFWEPFSRQRRGLRNPRDVEEHVQTVVAAAADEHGRRYFVTDYVGREMGMRRLRLARPEDGRPAQRGPPDAQGDGEELVLYDPGEFAARGDRGTDGTRTWGRPIEDRAPDEAMRLLQRRIEEEMRQNFAAAAAEGDAGGRTQLQRPEQLETPGEGSAGRPEQPTHLGGMAPPVLLAEEQRVGMALAQPEAARVSPCCYRDFRRLGRGVHSPDSHEGSQGGEQSP